MVVSGDQMTRQVVRQSLIIIRAFSIRGEYHGVFLLKGLTPSSHGFANEFVFGGGRWRSYGGLTKTTCSSGTSSSTHSTTTIDFTSEEDVD